MRIEGLGLACGERVKLFFSLYLPSFLICLESYGVCLAVIEGLTAEGKNTLRSSASPRVGCTLGKRSFRHFFKSALLLVRE